MAWEERAARRGVWEGAGIERWGAVADGRGFTLIELLIVMGIIGILAAIAVPQFASYRRRSYDARSRTDLRNAAAAEEYLFALGFVYRSCADAASCQVALPGYKPSQGVQIAISATDSTFTGTSVHPDGATVWRYDSAGGGFIN